MEEFVTFKLLCKLRERGYNNNNPRFEGHIYDVLRWLREEKKYHIEFVGNACGYLFIISNIPSEGGTDRYCSDGSGPNDGGTWDKYEDCALAGIEYVLDNLISQEVELKLIKNECDK